MNSYMKIQDDILNELMDRHAHTHDDEPKPICSLNFFKVVSVKSNSLY